MVVLACVYIFGEDDYEVATFGTDKYWAPEIVAHAPVTFRSKPIQEPAFPWDNS